MKFYSLAIVVVVALALGGVFGFSLGNNTSADVSQPAAEEAPSAAEARVGAVGVLQSVSAEGLSLQTHEGIQFMTITSPAAGIDQLKVGDKVAVWAQEVNGQLAVRQIVVVPETPQRMHYLGLVANVADDRIDIVGQQGETTSFRVDAATQRMPDAARAAQVGDTVTVVAKPDPLGDGWLAVAVVIR